jgi:hypothetical protein
MPSETLSSTASSQVAHWYQRNIGGGRRAVPWLLASFSSDFVKQYANAIDNSWPSVWQGLHDEGQYQMFATGMLMPN